MSIEEYEKVYAETRVADIDAQVAALDVDREALLAQRERYAPKPKRATAAKSDKS